MARKPNENQDAVLSERVVARVTKSEKNGLRWLVSLRAADVDPELADRVNEGMILRRLLNRELAAKGWTGEARDGGAPPATPDELPAPGERVVELDGEGSAAGTPPGKPKRARR